MKRFIIYYEHLKYGYYTHKSDDEFETIQEALNDFIENFAHKKVYGIMEVS